MNTRADKAKENKNRTVAGGLPKLKGNSESVSQFADNKTEAIAQRKRQENTNNNVQQSGATQEMVDKFVEPIQKKGNNTGLPDNLKAGIENLSGFSMDDVKVHYNSDKPAHIQSHAYAKGSEIHLASGQEKHLPHEAWHVVQQDQGRVKPALQLKEKINVIDDQGLEKEADVMGEMATKNIHHNDKKQFT